VQELKIIVVFFAVGGISSLAYAIAFGRYKYLIPLMAAWMAIIATVFVIKNIWIAFLVVLLVKLIFVKNDVEKSIVFFLSLLPVIPASFVFPFVKPGMLYFMDLNMPLVLSMVFLLPLIPKIASENEGTAYRSDVMFTLLLAIFLFGSFRERYEFQITFFAGVREVITTVFTILIPYYVLSRGLRGIEQISNVIKGMVVTGTFIAVFAFVEAILKWKIYPELGGYLNAFGAGSIHNLYEVRYGLLRVAVSLTHPITLGFYLSFIFGLVVYLLRSQKASRLGYILFYGLFSGAMYLTISRGAWVGFAVIFFVLLAYKIQPKARLMLLLLSLLLTPFIVFIGVDNSAQSSGNSSGEVDEFGTMEYRYNLALASVKVIPRQFFFGSRTYKNYPEMQALEQGQKIIDIVNGYLNIALDYGVIAMAIFLVLLMRAALEGVRSYQYGFDYEVEEYQFLGISLIAIVYSLAIQLVFTSFGGEVAAYLFIIMALSRSIKFSREDVIEGFVSPVSSASDEKY
jgi:hypothetical protein